VPTLIHPTTIISRFAKISNSGVLIGNNCEIQNDVIIDEGCVLWSQILVCHNTHIGPYTFVGPKTLIGAYIEVEQRAFIGQGSLLVSGKATHIGAQSLIGAGSVVTKPVPDKAIVVGNPAKILKYKP